jgi:hypothetical protein
MTQASQKTAKMLAARAGELSPWRTSTRRPWDRGHRSLARALACSTRCVSCCSSLVSSACVYSKNREQVSHSDGIGNRGINFWCASQSYAASEPATAAEDDVSRAPGSKRIFSAGMPPSCRLPVRCCSRAASRAAAARLDVNIGAGASPRMAEGDARACGAVRETRLLQSSIEILFFIARVSQMPELHSYRLITR